MSTSTEVEDYALLREYVASQSETAFRTLVERHVDMVYATALRQVGDAHLAEEATQAVFIALAKKARGLSSSTILAGWLFRAAHFAAAKVQRAEVRRKHWEQQAAQMEPNPSDSAAAAWEQMAPQLNEALNALKEPDRDALLLRFFESKTMAQVGSALGTSEGAAKMRVARALEQLRGIFQARGIALPVTVLAAALSTSTTQAAPVGLAASITTSALLQSSTLPLLTKGILLLMNWNARKSAVTAIVVLSLTTATSTSLLAVVLWKQTHSGADATVPAAQSQPPDERRVAFSRSGSGPGDLDIRPGKDGTMHVRTEDGDFVVTNGVNHFVTTDDQGRTKELTIVTDENGRTTRRISARAFRGSADGPARARGEAGGGFGGGVGGARTGAGGIGGEVHVEEEENVLAPPTPAKP